MTRRDFRTYIGGGDIAAILGVGYKTALELWAEKTGRREQSPATPRMRMGLLAEQMILDDFAAENGVEIFGSQTFVQSAKNERHGGHIDGYYFDDDMQKVVIDAKLNCRDYCYADGILPIQNQAQGQWYMYCCDAPRMMFHVLHLAADTYSTYELKRDDALIVKMKDAADSFLAAMDMDIPPEPDITRDSVADWNEWGQRAAKKQVIVSGEIASAVTTLAKIKAQNSTTAKLEKELNQTIKFAFDNADEMFGPDGVLIAKSSRKKSGEFHAIKWLAGADE